MTGMRNILILAAALTALPAFAQAPAFSPNAAAKPADNMQQLRDKLSGDKSAILLRTSYPLTFPERRAPCVE